MSRPRALPGLLVALLALLLTQTLTPARAQVASWWMGEADGGVARQVSWWLGEEGAAATANSSPVSWWLGGTGDAQPQPTQANQTLSWWLGSSANASNGEASAQPERPASDVPDYAAWKDVVARADAAIDDSQTPNIVLERLRAEIVDWRQRFLAAQNANRLRIDTIRNQISALGPVPAEGETEPDEIAQRRAALNGELGRLQAPGIAAEEAYLGADGLIREIDTILRERQANELLQLGPSPLVPTNWPQAYQAIAGVGTNIWQEARDGWASETSRAYAREQLPMTLLLTLLGVGLVTRGRRLSESLSARLLAGSGRRAKRVVLALLVSLGQVILPFVGTLLLVGALTSTGLVGARGRILVAAIPMIAFVVLGARWLGNLIFARVEEAALLGGLTPERRAEGRFYSTLIGVLLGLAGLLAATAPHEGETLVAHVVLGFPVLLLGGLILVRLGQILLISARAEGNASERSTSASLLYLIGRGVILLGLLGPTLAAIGYYMAGRFLVFPSVLSLALLAFLVILQRLAADLYALATRRDEDKEDEALVPVLIGFGLAIAAIPLLALIWGARVSDITELWARLREGFAIGETRIAPGDFLTFALVFAVGYVATRLFQGALKTSVLPKTKLDPGGQTAVVSGVGYLGIFLAAILAITSAGIDLSNLAIVAGALSVGIGFGLQNIVSNFISGIILLVERPISEGDWIDVNGQMGFVRDISVRSTRIETFDRTDVIVPNSDLISGVVTNFTRGNLTGRIIVKVGVAYGTDTRRVEQILREVAEAHPLVTLNPAPGVLFMGFGADSLDFEIRAILRDVNFSLSTRSDLNHEIARRFAEEGIEIPFAQRDIWLRNPEVLTGSGRDPAPAKGTVRSRKQKQKHAAPLDPQLQDPPGVEDFET